VNAKTVRARQIAMEQTKLTVKPEHTIEVEFLRGIVILADQSIRGSVKYSAPDE